MTDSRRRKASRKPVAKITAVRKPHGPDASRSTETSLFVQRVRKGTKLTQEQFARRHKFGLSTLRSWEQAMREPRASAMLKLMKIRDSIRWG